MNDLSSFINESITYPFMSIRADLGVLRFSGVDSAKFLQGQTSCDITQLTLNNRLTGAICNLQGRVIANFYLIREGDDILMLLSQDLLSKIQLHLTKFAVFFKTTLTDATADYQLHSLFHSSALALELSDQAHHSRLDQTNSSITLINSAPLFHYLLITPLQEAVPELAPLIDTNDQHALALLAAEPLVNADTSELFLPQMLNMQLTGGISFKKGCYTGQEIVARMQYRGKLKKRLYLFTTQTPLSLATSPSIQSATGQVIGELVSLQRLNKRTLILAVINNNAIENGVYIEGQRLENLPLPYSLPDSASE